MASTPWNILLLATLSLSGFSLFAQSTSSTLEHWSWATYGLRLNPTWDVQLSTQLRIRGYPGQGTPNTKVLVELDGGYAPQFRPWLRAWRLRAGVRWIGTDLGPLQSHLRLHGDLLYRYRQKRWYLAYRLRYQANNNFKTPEASTEQYWNKDLRNLLGVGYALKPSKWQVGLWGEVFYYDEHGTNSSWSRYRLGVKTRYQLTQRQSLELRYFWEGGIGQYQERRIHTLVLQYRYAMTLRQAKTPAAQ